MTDDRHHAIVPRPPDELAPASRLAERTLAARSERDRRAVAPARQTLVVGPGGYASIQAAVDAAREGDTVLIQSGRYEEVVVVRDKAITVRGDGSRDDVVVTSDEAPVFTLVDTGMSLSNLTIDGGGPAANPLDGRALNASVDVVSGAPQLLGIHIKGGPGVLFGRTTGGSLTGSRLDEVAVGVAILSGASPLIEDNELSGHGWAGIEIRGAGAQPMVRHNRVRDRWYTGIRVSGGASPRIEENEISGSRLAGIGIGDAGTAALVRANRIHDCQYAGAWIVGGESRIQENEIWGNGHAAIHIAGDPAALLVQGNRIRDGQASGILILGGASPRIEDNEIWENTLAAIEIRDAGSEPLVRANRIHDGLSGGIFIHSGASPRIEDNEIWENTLAAIEIRDAGSEPLVCANRIHDGLTFGILVLGGASPRIEDNEIWGNASPGISVRDAGSEPLVRANHIHDGLASGVRVEGGAKPLLEGNEIWGNKFAGIWIRDHGSDPLVQGNRVHDCQYAGVYVVDLAKPAIEDNDIWGNHASGIEITFPGSDPLVRANRIHDGHGAGVSVSNRANPTIEDNDIWGNRFAGVSISDRGSEPIVRANRIHDGHDAGVTISRGAPQIEGNEIWANTLAGIEIDGAGSAPEVRGNRVHDGHAGGIDVSADASPRIEDNEVWGNAFPGIEAHEGESRLEVGPPPFALVKLLQAHDPEAIGPSPVGDVGDFFNTLTAVNYGKVLRFVPIMPFMHRLLIVGDANRSRINESLEPTGAEVGAAVAGLVCRSIDMRTGTGTPGGVCDRCPLSKWTDEMRPLCTEAYNVAASTERGELIILSFGSSSARVGKQLFSMIRMRPGAMETIFEATSYADHRDLGGRFVPRVRPGNRAPRTLIDRIRLLATQLHGVPLDVSAAVAAEGALRDANVWKATDLADH